MCDDEFILRKGINELQGSSINASKIIHESAQVELRENHHDQLRRQSFESTGTCFWC